MDARRAEGRWFPHSPTSFPHPVYVIPALVYVIPALVYVIPAPCLRHSREGGNLASCAIGRTAWRVAVPQPSCRKRKLKGGD